VVLYCRLKLDEKKSSRGTFNTSCPVWICDDEGISYSSQPWNWSLYVTYIDCLEGVAMISLPIFFYGITID
jgi:hypothetical protein